MIFTGPLRQGNNRALRTSALIWFSLFLVQRSIRGNSAYARQLNSTFSISLLMPLLTRSKRLLKKRLKQARSRLSMKRPTERCMKQLLRNLNGRASKQYEISNFAKPGFECKHNLNYWQNNPYIGVGPSAGSYWQGKRTLNIADIEKYIEAIEQGKEATAESEIRIKLRLPVRRQSWISADDAELTWKSSKAEPALTQWNCLRTQSANTKNLD